MSHHDIKSLDIKTLQTVGWRCESMTREDRRQDEEPIFGNFWSFGTCLKPTLQIGHKNAVDII